MVQLLLFILFDVRGAVLLVHHLLFDTRAFAQGSVPCRPSFYFIFLSLQTQTLLKIFFKHTHNIPRANNSESKSYIS